MKQKFVLNQGWLFSRKVPVNIQDLPEDGRQVNLPYTWPAKGEGAYKGKCVYRKELPIPAELSAIRLYLAFEGVSNTASVYINERCVGIHRGGFTPFRVEITDAVVFGQTNIISVVADNADYSAMCRLLPESEFFGGIWGDVTLILVGVTHFDLSANGSDGIYINTMVAEGVGKVAIHAKIANPVNYDIVSFTVYDAAGARIGAAAAAPKDANAVIDVPDPIFWFPTRDKAYLYKLKAKLLRDGEILDEVEVDFAFRKIEAGGQRGLLINGRRTRVKGVCWGQDASVPKTDFVPALDLLTEMGANAVRLLNYYQCEKLFHLCDKKGILVWCELPLDPDAVNDDSRDNLIEQYVELARLYYNHPSVCFVAADGGLTPEGRRAENEIYQALCAFDINRLRVSPDCVSRPDEERMPKYAQAAGCKADGDRQSPEELTALLDGFRVSSPETAVFLSEYGVAGDVRYHSADPKSGDFSEEYQALYHEMVWDAVCRRDFVLGSFVSELYDTAGFCGGLILSDGETRKDAFWFYRSQWSNEKFVKIASERFVNRVEKKITLKVYSNCRTVTLSVNGKTAKTPTGGSGVFVFSDLRLTRGQNVITAETEDGCTDTVVLHRRKNEDLSYRYAPIAE